MIIERQSVVDAPAERVWARVVTPEGINDELRPWMTMSMPRGALSLTVDNVPVGTPVGRCWMRLFGVLPFDYDRLCIAELAKQLCGIGSRSSYARRCAWPPPS